jgi:5,10-methylene-tetrahydrofolate dehydrogenase/Methenyl tetrahydrofolate cyclohydrolase
MANILKGAAVATAINEATAIEVEKLKQSGITPTLAIVRIGERDDDISYERGATKRCEKVGVTVKNIILPNKCSEKTLIETIEQLNNDSSVHGVLLFRPLPKHINDNNVRNTLSPTKDIDGITDSSLAGVFTGTDLGFAPCTARACIEILDFYNIDVTGKRTMVIGRSLVVGKPVAIMLMDKNATVTICHTKTIDMPLCCREADILIVSAGRAGIINKDYFNSNQIIIDVGINITEEGKLCGDVDFDTANAIVDSITPVPGGVGTVTTSVLVRNVVIAAKRQFNEIV